MVNASVDAVHSKTIVCKRLLKFKRDHTVSEDDPRSERPKYATNPVIHTRCWKTDEITEFIRVSYESVCRISVSYTHLDVYKRQVFILRAELP